jgi:aminopeptidase N
VRLGSDRLEPRLEGDGYVVDLPNLSEHHLDFLLRGKIPERGDANLRRLSSSSAPDGVFLPASDNWIPYARGPLLRYRLDVTLPVTQRAVATGRLVEEIIDDQYYRARFETTRASEAPSLFAGPYRIQEQKEPGLRLRTYFHAGLEDQADAYLDAAKIYIDRYRQRIGDYPYSDFHIVSAPLPVGLGFPGLTYIDRRIVPLPFMRTRSLAHEVLHNWWGNAVSVDYAGGNWAEGLTTYMADYALERDKGEAAARSMRVKWLRDYAALPAERDQPVRAFRSKQHQAGQVIGYNKVAFIFHMLSMEIGQSAFDAGLRRFWVEHKYQVAGWQELKSAFEHSSGRDLDWFFEQWLDRRGAPRLGLGEHQVTQVEAGYRTNITVLQPVAGYRFQLPVLLVTDDGAERREITVNATRTSIEWTTPSKPRYIQFDPDSDVFRRLQPDEAPPILRDVTLDPMAVTVIGADDEAVARIARELATRLIDAQPRIVELEAAVKADRPLLLISTSDRLPELLASLSLQRPMELPRTAHGAAAWTTQLPNGSPALVISADNATELQALLRPLPHYGGQSYILFAGGRALERGIWPISRGALYRDLGGS